MTDNKFDLDTPILNFSDGRGTCQWTVRHAVEGVQIFGGIGSGKTSGSGRTLALKYLTHGFGGLVLTVKPDEAELWQEYCRLAGRTDDLIIVRPGGPYRFDFIEYEQTVSSKNGLPFTANLVDVLQTVIRAAQDKGGGSNEQFWDSSLAMLIHNAIELSLLAYGRTSVKDLYEIASSVPKTTDKPKEDSQRTPPYIKAMQAAARNIRDKVEAWKSTLPEADRERLRDPEASEQAIVRQFGEASRTRMTDMFFNQNYRSLHEKTRSIIDFMFTGFLFLLLNEPASSLFGHGGSTVTPEDSLKGKIILLDLPVKVHHKAGRDCQILFKYLWQRAMEKRDVSQNPRPCFLWADEAQHFIHELDAAFQATARSSRVATVYLSQNLPNYFTNMGGGGGQSVNRVKGFLGTLNTKIFHANADTETNRYASDIIGKGYKLNINLNENMGDKPSFGEGKSFILEDLVRPEEFGMLKTGGPLNDYIVEAYVHLQGTVFPNGYNHNLVAFNQQFIPQQ